MKKIIRRNFTVASGKLNSAIKMQERFFPFTEKPSDKYHFTDEDLIFEPGRLNAFDLFSLFTADIIKKEVVFVR